MRVSLWHPTALSPPPADPDDHFDLATAFALAAEGSVDLRGVVIDHPPTVYPFGDPAGMSVAQLNRIAGTAVPVVTGSGQPMKRRADSLPGGSGSDVAAAQFSLGILARSAPPW